MTPFLLALVALTGQDAAAQDAAGQDASGSVAAREDAASAPGGVATVVTLPDENAALRTVAAGALAAAGEKWGLLVPPLKPETLEVCQAEIRCLLNLASDRGASHLFVVGVATLGEGEVVVSLQLFETAGSGEVMSFTEVVSLGSDPFQVGHDLAAAQIDEVAGVPGPGEVSPRWPPPPAPEVIRYQGLSILSIAGWSVVGAGVAAAALGLGVGVVQSLDVVGGLPPESRNITVIVVAPVALALIGAGLTAVTVDLFVQ